MCDVGAEEVRKTRITEVHSSALTGEVGLEDAHIGWPHIRDIPRELKCVGHSRCSFVVCLPKLHVDFSVI